MSAEVRVITDEESQLPTDFEEFPRLEKTTGPALKVPPDRPTAAYNRQKESNWGLDDKISSGLLSDTTEALTSVCSALVFGAINRRLAGLNSCFTDEILGVDTTLIKERVESLLPAMLSHSKKVSDG